MLAAVLAVLVASGHPLAIRVAPDLLGGLQSFTGFGPHSIREPLPGSAWSPEGPVAVGYTFFRGFTLQVRGCGLGSRLVSWPHTGCRGGHRASQGRPSLTHTCELKAGCFRNSARKKQWFGNQSFPFFPGKEGTVLYS